jgi:anti-anti-sigma factor
VGAFDRSPLWADFTMDADGETVVVHLRGELDIEALSSLDGIAAMYEGEHPHDLRVDLSGVDFVDSTGVGWLLRTRASVLGAGRRWELVGVAPQVERVLGITGVADLLLGETSAQQDAEDAEPLDGGLSAGSSDV